MCFFQGWRGQGEQAICHCSSGLSSCLRDKAIYTLVPFLSCLCPVWKRAAELCFSFPAYLKERKKKSGIHGGSLLFSLTLLLLLMLWPLFPCLFVLSWHLSFVQSAALLPGAGPLPASFKPPPFQILSRVPDMFPETVQ